ncbi:MAG: hypothetical protein GPJ54_01865 [Candidatus Heimdallarchaeota archaeon]|nr:hypothetical protein [Candidatus Heimdallarchaeota archaeon]
MRSRTLYPVLLIIGFIIYPIAVKGSAISNDTTMGDSVIPSSAIKTNSELKTETLQNKTKRTFSLPLEFIQHFQLSSKDIPGFDRLNKLPIDLPEIEFFDLNFGASLNIDLTMEFNNDLSMIYTSPLMPTPIFSIGRSISSSINSKVEISSRFFLEGTIGDLEISISKALETNGTWNLKLPNKEWNYDLIKIPKIGKYINNLMHYGFNFSEGQSEFNGQFSGHLDLNPRIGGVSSINSNTCVNEVLCKELVINPEGLTINDLEYKEIIPGENINLTESLSYDSTIQFVTDYKGGLNFTLNMDIEAILNNVIEAANKIPYFQLPFDSSDVEKFQNWANIPEQIVRNPKLDGNFSSFSHRIRQLQFKFPTQSISVYNVTSEDVIHTSKNQFRKSEIVFNDTSFSLNSTLFKSLTNILDNFAINNVTATINASLWTDFNFKRKYEIIAPLVANQNETIDVLIHTLPMSLNLSAGISATIKINHGTTNLINSSYSYPFFSGYEIELPVGKESRDLESRLSFFIPLMQNLTVFNFDISSILSNFGLELELIPHLFYNQTSVLNLQSREIVHNEDFLLRNAEWSKSTIRMQNGTKYNQISSFVNETGVGNFGLGIQPQLNVRLDSFGKAIKIPLKYNNFTVTNINGEFTKSFEIKSNSVKLILPTYYIDYDVDAPFIFNFEDNWVIDIERSNLERVFRIEDSKSGIQNISINSNLGITPTLQSDYVSFLLISLNEHVNEGEIWIRMIDQKNNTREYKLNIKIDNPRISTFDETNSQFKNPSTQPNVPDILLLGLVIVVFAIIMKFIESIQPNSRRRH